MSGHSYLRFPSAHQADRGYYNLIQKIGKTGTGIKTKSFLFILKREVIIYSYFRQKIIF